MALPATYRSFRRTTGDLPLTIEISTEAVPKQLGDNDVLIKIHSVSLNYRDVAMLHGKYPVPVRDGLILASDCSAEVIAVGSAVKRFQIGDFVSPIISTNFIKGTEDVKLHLGSLGGYVDGVLREYAMYSEEVLVQLPKNLSWDEAATITCAGLTAWKSLNGLEDLTSDSYVLLEGTGGVSMFALLLLVNAGVHVIITSSSDEKIANVKKISHLVEGINYKTHSKIAPEVQRLTEGKGVAIVLNNAGVHSIPSNIDCLGDRGTINLVGFLEGFTADWNPAKLGELLVKQGILRGAPAGSRIDAQVLNKYLEDKNIALGAIIDRKFTFDRSKEAFDYLYQGKHIGKVIINI
ncbi:hypothetical protein CFAM422_013174 [Trichoderma lentiforme]|uniref:Enoyl reductase (ER) domain-containing protein n=1 Tax=Trichoderma lentiforme TaxID=1567552 RepID=A0A9P5C5U4_9HYPO|nr:hypothetical protein CFAM422_013174 [Trichoderma lentiforme]